MSALGGDDHAAALRRFGEGQRPRAIVILSAHWQLPNPGRVTAWERAPLVYDFGGFPPELYEIQYPAAGDPSLAARVSEMTGAALETHRGLDHGAWVPLRLAWPDAGIPVVELALTSVAPQDLFALGRALRPLREEGVLIAGSGGIVHNLSRVQLWSKDAPIDSWAAEFDRWVADRIGARETELLFAYRTQAPHAALAVPTPEHFDPIFPALGAAFDDESVHSIFEGFQYGNLSMRTFSMS